MGLPSLRFPISLELGTRHHFGLGPWTARLVGLALLGGFLVLLDIEHPSHRALRPARRRRKGLMVPHTMAAIAPNEPTAEPGEMGVQYRDLVSRAWDPVAHRNLAL